MTSEDNSKNPMGDLVAGSPAEATGASSAIASAETVTSKDVEKNDAPASNATETKKREADDGGDGTTVEAKRPKTIATTSSENTNPNEDTLSNENQEEGEPLDLANVFGYKAGERFEVQWDIVHDEGTDNTYTVTRWWGATLLEYDGKTEDSVAVRVLDYDPLPDEGYSERSKEPVIFLTPDLLACGDDPDRHLSYRREGVAERQEKDVVWYNEGDLNEKLNGILMAALNKNKEQWNSLPPARQAALAEVIAKKKEKLMEVLKDEQSIITSESIGDILQKAFG